MGLDRRRALGLGLGAGLYGLARSGPAVRELVRGSSGGRAVVWVADRGVGEVLGLGADLLVRGRCGLVGVDRLLAGGRGVWALAGVGRGEERGTITWLERGGPAGLLVRESWSVPGLVTACTLGGQAGAVGELKRDVVCWIGRGGRVFLRGPGLAGESLLSLRGASHVASLGRGIVVATEEGRLYRVRLPSVPHVDPGPGESDCGVLATGSGPRRPRGMAVVGHRSRGERVFVLARDRGATGVHVHAASLRFLASHRLPGEPRAIGATAEGVLVLTSRPGRLVHVSLEGEVRACSVPGGEAHCLATRSDRVVTSPVVDRGPGFCLGDLGAVAAGSSLGAVQGVERAREPAWGNAAFAGRAVGPGLRRPPSLPPGLRTQGGFSRITSVALALGQ